MANGIDKYNNSYNYIFDSWMYLFFFGNWDKGLMKGLYFLLSEIISILLAIALRYILDYWWVFLIIPSLIIAVFVVLFIKSLVIIKKEVK